MSQQSSIERRWDEMKRWEDEFFISEASDIAKSYYKWSEQIFNQLGETRKQKVAIENGCLFISFASMVSA